MTAAAGDTGTPCAPRRRDEPSAAAAMPRAGSGAASADGHLFRTARRGEPKPRGTPDFFRHGTGDDGDDDDRSPRTSDTSRHRYHCGEREGEGGGGGVFIHVLSSSGFPAKWALLPNCLDGYDAGSAGRSIAPS